MKINLEELEHQENAIKNLLEAFPDLDNTSTEVYSNPIQIIHKCLWDKLIKFSEQNIDKILINKKLNQKSLDLICDKWKELFAQTYATKYEYDQLTYNVDTSIYENGDFKEVLEQGLIGTNTATDIADDERNLYEQPIAYDSLIELNVEKRIAPKKIKVFGKLPRKAIKVPTYTGGSTTPDFIYVTEKNKNVDVTLLVETKANDLRMNEVRAIKAQEKLFKNIPNIQWELVQNAEKVDEILRKL